MFTSDLENENILSTASLVAALGPGVTPGQTAGPFYPSDHLPVDKINVDADLVLLEGQSEKAIGDVVVIEGLVVDQSYKSIPGALVEIWQACASGRYKHVDDPNPAPLDPHFQYWGKAITDAKGFYRFRTIIPGSYPAEEGWNRPAHIHFKITREGFEDVVTQMYFKHDPLNAIDQILQELEKSEQDKLIVDFQDRADETYPIGNFNIQLTKTN